mmetsp:Transcript_40703/g.39306  ORF Transcript_40703/g.39306 Transcript_40703/m.39306 type:complete len:520 (+) Transcript_40703:73-1632(+)
MVRTNVFLSKSSARLYSWVAFLLIGIIMGLIAFLLDLVVESLEMGKIKATQRILNKGYIGAAWFVFLLISLVFGIMAAVMTAYWGPGAAGSGTAELMGYLNGINYPKFISFKTLITKIVATILAVASGLCIGKEGPLAHIGAIVGVAVVYLPFYCFQTFRNDLDKRELSAAGAAAGVSAAFGSPIGGSLFAYEISRPTTFWSFGLMWKTFFCSSVSTFVLNILTNLKLKENVSVANAGLIKFGKYDEHPYMLTEFPFFLILGLLGGILGSFFIFVNHNVNKLRDKLVTTRKKKVIETSCLVFLTASIIFLAPLTMRDECYDASEDHLETANIRYLCEEGDYNRLATFLFNPENKVIKALLDKYAEFTYGSLVVYLLIWYTLTIITYGTCVPAGIFLPGMLIGCDMGKLVGQFVKTYIISSIHVPTYAIIGAASVLAGYSRLSFSLAVIMLETTENLSLFLPVIFALFVAFSTGRLFNRSIYVVALRFKKIPFLQDKIPSANCDIRAFEMMSENVCFLEI